MSEQESAVAEPTAEDAIAETEAQTEQEAEESQALDGEAPEGKEESKPEGAEEKPDNRTRETAQERKERQRAARERQEAELEATKARLDRIKKASKGVEEPNREDFTDPDEYIAAKAAFRVAKATTAREEAFVESEVEEIEAQQKAVVEQAWSEQMQDARQRYPDFDQAISDPNVPYFGAVPNLIKSSDMGADLAYHLAKNRADALRISQLEPLAAAKEMGRLEAILSTPQPKTETKAPPPIEALDGAAQPSKDPAKMTPDQYRAWRQSGGSF